MRHRASDSNYLILYFFMLNATVYKIAVLSLTGIMEEPFASKESVRQLNLAIAERTGLSN